MAKLKHTFVRGRMNKDIDERMVPNGEYRDALNIQVATSEGSNVGAIENILGNTKKNLKALPNTEWDLKFGLSRATCIGVLRDTQNNKVYWFITGETTTLLQIDAILEYDQELDIVSPVLVDTQGVLNFSKDYLITGINLIDGLLAWTDDLNEPRILNIDTFKAGSTQGSATKLSAHTQVYGRNFVDTDITVIKLKPETALGYTAEASLRGGYGTGLDFAAAEENFTEPVTGGYAPIEVGGTKTITISGNIPNWQNGDIILLSTSYIASNNIKSTYDIRAEITAGSGTTSITLEILSISQDLPNAVFDWDCVLEEKEPMFELSFPRFAYRWKYKENEYSAFSPWTSPVFLAGEYDYNSSEAHNKAMKNNLRSLTLNNFAPPPANVEQIDILYKDSSSPVIYKVETIPASATSFTVTSELIYSVISSEQFLRPYDNVPIKAKAQEIIANRLVYGNYVQNYNVPNNTDISVTVNSSAVANVGTPEESIKSLRTYQVGIVYLDDYGRETPVFTSDTSTVIVPKINAEESNTLDVTSAQSTPGSWAKKFKYYIKDISNEYYNLILDRYYYGEDGLWLSFPSAERNKVTEEDYIVLKKAHNSDAAVKEEARYKIIEISNEAPDSISTEKQQLTTSNISALIWQADARFAAFTGPDITVNRDFNTYFGEAKYIRFKNASNTQTSFIRINSGGLATGNTSYTVEFANLLSDEDIAVLIGGNYSVSLYKDQKEAKPEFNGRFFVKVNSDSVLEQNIIYNFVPDSSYYTTVQEQNVVRNTPDNPADLTSAVPPANRWAWGEYTPGSYFAAEVFPPQTGNKVFGLGFIRYNTVDLNDPNGPDAGGDGFVSNLQAGSAIQLRKSNGQWSDLLEVESVNIGIGNRSGFPAPNGTQSYYYFTVTLTQPLPTGFGDGSTNVPTGFKLLKRNRTLPVLFDENSEVLISPNPAVFETEPRESADLDIYFEASDAIDIANLNNTITLPYTNCYTFGNGVESNRIRDDFNAKTMSKGVKASSTIEDKYQQERRKAGLIYSGIYNNLAGINETNQFIAGLKITKDLDPVYGGIQKLFARDTNLLAFAEDKVYAVLADKDALFNADGNANLLSTNRVLGNASTFAGEFGISKNPESFASYGFRVYFTDKARGAVLRLSNDGITEISEKGMTDFFVDAFAANTTPVIGSFDESTSAYNIKLNNESVSYKERVDGWPTRLSFDPEFAVSLNNEYYTFKNGEIWEHSNETRNNFYGSQESSQVTVVFNDAPSSIKNFKTLSYEGTEKWTAAIATDKQNGTVSTWRDNEGIYHNFIKGDLVIWDNVTQTGNIDSKEFSVQGIGTITTISPVVPYLIQAADTVNTSLSVGDTVYIKREILPPTVPKTFDILKVGDVVAIGGSRIEFNDPSGIAPQVGEYAFFLKSNAINTSGLLGYYANVTFTNTDTSFAELFAINSEVFISSE